jgi:hypothetical protein
MFNASRLANAISATSTETVLTINLGLTNLDSAKLTIGNFMRYLFLLIIYCMPTWVVANLLDTDTRYSCQTETTFGWEGEASFSSPQLWVSGNQYIVEPAPQEIPQKGFGGDLKNVPVTHTLQLLDDNSLFYCAKGGTIVKCFEKSGTTLNVTHRFTIVNSKKEASLLFFMNNADFVSTFRAFGNNTNTGIAFEGGTCQAF